MEKKDKSGFGWPLYFGLGLIALGIILQFLALILNVLAKYKIVAR